MFGHNKRQHPVKRSDNLIWLKWIFGLSGHDYWDDMLSNILYCKGILGLNWMDNWSIFNLTIR